jgi:hypothetical protein
MANEQELEALSKRVYELNGVKSLIRRNNTTVDLIEGLTHVWGLGTSLEFSTNSKFKDESSYTGHTHLSLTTLQRDAIYEFIIKTVKEPILKETEELKLKFENM